MLNRASENRLGGTTELVRWPTATSQTASGTRFARVIYVKINYGPPSDHWYAVQFLDDDSKYPPNGNPNAGGTVEELIAWIESQIAGILAGGENPLLTVLPSLKHESYVYTHFIADGTDSATLLPIVGEVVEVAEVDQEDGTTKKYIVSVEPLDFVTQDA